MDHCLGSPDFLSAVVSARRMNPASEGLRLAVGLGAE